MAAVPGAPLLNARHQAQHGRAETENLNMVLLVTKVFSRRSVLGRFCFEHVISVNACLPFRAPVYGCYVEGSWTWIHACYRDFGVARGPLQARPLQIQHGSEKLAAHVHLLVNFWGARFCMRSCQQKSSAKPNGEQRLCTQKCSIVGHLLDNSPNFPAPLKV